MKSLFDKDAYEEITERMGKLTPQSQRQWGKMDVGQMLAHCKEAFKVPLSDTPLKQLFIGQLFGWIFKKSLYTEKPWKQNLPTASQFIIKDSRNFDNERNELLSLVNKFYKSKPADIEKIIHPMFGKFTGDQWGKSMYKHLGHHLTQFGV